MKWYHNYLFYFILDSFIIHIYIHQNSNSIVYLLYIKLLLSFSNTWVVVTTFSICYIHWLKIYMAMSFPCLICVILSCLDQKISPVRPWNNEYDKRQAYCWRIWKTLTNTKVSAKGLCYNYFKWSAGTIVLWIAHLKPDLNINLRHWCEGAQWWQNFQLTPDSWHYSLLLLCCYRQWCDSVQYNVFFVYCHHFKVFLLVGIMWMNEYPCS